MTPPVTRPADPPRLARRLLALALPEDAREHVEGDLLEVYARRRADDGDARARLWYWREAASFSARFAVERLRARARRPAEGRARFRFAPSALDVRLALRVLVKYPGLTLVGGLAIAVAIALGSAFFQFGGNVFRPTIPLPEGDRIVGIRNWDAAASAPELRSLHDFATWRTELRSVRELGAFAGARRNLITEDGRVEPVEIAEITASAFRLVRVPPLLGRPLVESDEAPDAPPVVVIGHAVWRARFGGDPGVVGRTVRLGGSRSTVVGVMPEGFAFPARHAMWAPFRARAADHARREGPAIRVFGRLAPGVSRAEAQAELAAVGARTAAAHPTTHARLRPRVVPYASLFLDFDGGVQLYLLQALFAMVLVVACANVATLVFARTAARENEIAVRVALGAGRTRIVVQLFVEALVLASLAAVVGLAAAWGALRTVLGAVGVEDGGMPFWFDFALSPGTVLYAAGLAVLGAVIAGVVPALKVTEGGVQTRLRQAAAGGSGLRFGRLWTGIIVAQVAISVAVLPILVSEGWDAWRDQAAAPGYPAHEYLSAVLAMDRETAPGAAGAAAAAYEARLAAAFGERRRELARRLAAEPGVVAVTFASVLPGMGHPTVGVVAGEAAPGAAGHAVRTAAVEPGFFDAFDAPVIAGRAFHAGDEEPGRDVVVVNQSFVRQVLGGRDAIGREVREVPRPGQPPARAYRIVGVVRDLGMGTQADGPGARAGLYRPAGPGGGAATRLAVRVDGRAPAALAPRLRAIALAVDPTLRVDDVRPLDQVGRAERLGMRVMALAIAAFAVGALMLSSAGIYAMMSFTVSQRTREIGIRAALGAHPGRIVRAIFSRALGQLAAGAAAGAVGTALLVYSGLSDQLAEDGPWLTLGVAGLVVAVGLAACALPAWRALRIQPTQALRQVG